jgi:transposase-like protein
MRKFDNEFKKEVVKNYLGRQSVMSISREIEVNENTIHKRKNFFARYKVELLEGGFFEDVNHARSESFSYVGGYYNRTRIHSTIGN